MKREIKIVINEEDLERATGLSGKDLDESLGWYERHIIECHAEHVFEDAIFYSQDFPENPKAYGEHMLGWFYKNAPFIADVRLHHKYNLEKGEGGD